MPELREKMKMDMELRGYSPRSIKNYIGHVSNFAKFYNKSPDLLEEKEIRDYLHYCIMEKKLSEGTVNYINASLKFFYTKTLDRYWNIDKLARVKEPRKLPVVLSPEEVKSIFDVTENLKHKAILMTVYSAGLRVSEVCNLRVTDICYIQRLLGHTRITTTTIYLHLRRMDLLNIRSPLDTLIGEHND